MYQVLLIDDEELILKGFQTVINWAEYRCTICGSAKSGSEGLEKIRALQPDIIFVDIRMGDMSGLDMLERAGDDIKKVKFVIVTGYREFEYAKKAIALGAFAYILKPTKLTELKSILEKAIAELDKECMQENDRKRLEEELVDGRLALREMVFSGILTKEDSWASYDVKESIYEMELSWFVVVTTNAMLHSVKVGTDPLSALRRMMYELFQPLYNASVIYPTISGEVSIVVSISNGSRNDGRHLATLLKQMLIQIEALYSCRVSAGISTVGHCTEELKHKYLESRQALEHRIYLDDSTLIFYDDIPKILPLFTEEDSVYSVLLIEQILIGDAKAVNEILDQIEAHFREIDVVQAKKIIINIIYRIYDSYDMFRQNGYHTDNHQFIFNCVMNYDDCEKSMGLLRELAMDMTEKIRFYNSKQMDIRLKEICEYIEKNYKNRITRGEIAEHIHVTPNYLSAFFNKEMHMGLMDYVIHVRIEAAKRLLSETSYKIAEVAYQCGFQDVYYFSKMFKARTGIAPKEWRRENQN